MHRIFIGYDPRQPVSYQVLHHSIIRNSSNPVSITPLIIEQLPIKRMGLTPFTFSRFLVPYLCNYEGWGLFMDADMLVTGDISELFELKDDNCDVMAVEHPEHQFERASLMLFNNEKCKQLTPEFIETSKDLHRLSWAENPGILPPEWNHLVGYDKPKKAHLIHYTAGIPCFEEVRKLGYVDPWIEEHQLCNSAVPWEALMGSSVHKANLNL